MKIDRIALVLLMTSMLKQQFLEKKLQDLGIEKVIWHKNVMASCNFDMEFIYILVDGKDQQLILVSFKIRENIMNSI